jgi:predicted GNAT family acetyltransferase
MAQGIWRLDSVEWTGNTTGSAQPASDADSDILVTWLKAFICETGAEESDDGVEYIVASRIRADFRLTDFWIWEDQGLPVAVSGYQRPTPSGMTIGLVYTPPEHRDKGYATALVAEQTQWLLDRGKKACFLCTDLTNPTSNSIYQRIGYKQVAEASWYDFGT